MFRVVYADIFTTTMDVIVHQVNCMGRMNSDIARDIRNRYPSHYFDYKTMCNTATYPTDLLGNVVVSKQYIGSDVAGLFGQLKYGKIGKFTDYDALQKAFHKLIDMYGYNAIAVPYGIGCGLGGGDWNTVYHIIKGIHESYEWTDNPVDIVIYNTK